MGLTSEGVHTKYKFINIVACGYLSSTGSLMIDRFINAINGCAHDISLHVCLHIYNYVSTVTVNTKNNTQTDVMGASIYCIYETVDH